MKKFLIIISVFAVSAGVALAQVVNFPDVSSDAWYYDGVLYAGENKIMTGYPNGYFGPNDDVNRAQLATVLMRMDTAELQSMYDELNQIRLHDVGELKGSGWATYRSVYTRFPVEGIQGDGEGLVKYEDVADRLERKYFDGSYYNNQEILGLPGTGGTFFFIREKGEYFGTHVYGPFYDDVDAVVRSVISVPTI